MVETNCRFQYDCQKEYIFLYNSNSLLSWVCSLTGNTPAASVQTVIDGGVEFYLLQGDMLRTVHNKAQVRRRYL